MSPRGRDFSKGFSTHPRRTRHKSIKTYLSNSFIKMCGFTEGLIFLPQSFGGCPDIGALPVLVLVYWTSGIASASIRNRRLASRIRPRTGLGSKGLRSNMTCPR